MAWSAPIIWTNAQIFLIESMGINFSDILIEIKTFPFKKIHLKISSAKWRSFCFGLNVLTLCYQSRDIYVWRYEDDQQNSIDGLFQ